MNIKGVVATGHPQTTQVAQQVLKEGGNAFDAAVAAFFMACMAEPVLSSLGGGGFVVAKNENMDVFSLDFFTHTPLRKKNLESLDFEEIVVDFGSTVQPFHMGYGSVAVPGCVKGMFELHRKFCKMSMAELMAPTIDAAKHGLQITKEQGAILSLVEPIYINRESARALFVKSDSGSVLKQGQLYQNSELADTLEVLSIEGQALFYRGEIAQKIEQAAESSGGSITLSDLNNYQTYWRRPHQAHYSNADVYLNPPPSAGGMLVRFALDQMVAQAGTDVHFGGDRFYRHLALAIELTQQARIEALSQSPFKQLEYEHLFNPELLHKYAEQVSRRHKSNNGTTHISVADTQGNVVALTVSNGEGCGEILAETGIMLNNMLGEDDLNPLGLNQWQPDKRLSSMMCPAVAVKKGSVTALGSGGSNRIRTAVLQVLINHLLCDLSLQSSVQSARMHFDDKLYLEAFGVDESIIESLKKLYPDMVLFPDRNFYFGGVNAVSVGDNNFQAVADARRGGAATVVS